MLKLEDVALELFEYKLNELRMRRDVRGGMASLWDLYNHLQRQAASLDAQQRRRLELGGRTLRHASTVSNAASSAPDFDALVLGGEGTDGDSRGEPGIETSASVPIVTPELAAEQTALRKLATRVWRHELDRFVRQLAGGLRAERDRNTARLLFATHRNLHLYLDRAEARGDSALSRFTVVEPIPGHEDSMLAVNDVESLAELVRETIDSVLQLAQEDGPFSVLGIAPGRELETMRRVARAVAADPYAGRTGLLDRPGPSPQQLRVAMQELGKERMRDDERLAQRRELEERLQRVLAFERHQRQMFNQDVARFGDLVDAFFGRLGRYLPRSVGGESGSPRLPGGVLFAVNPALAVEAVDPASTAATVRLKGPTRLRLGGAELSLAGSPGSVKLFLRGEEHSFSDEGSVAVERRWLHFFREGEYVHLRFEDASRSAAVRVAEAAAVLGVMRSPQRNGLVRVLQCLASGAVGEPSELMRAALENISGLVARAPDRAAAIRGFVQGAARAAAVDLTEETVVAMCSALQLALAPDQGALAEVLQAVDLGEVSVHTLTGEPLAIDAGPYTLTVRQYRASEPDGRDSLVVMLPGHALGTFDEYLIEPLGDGTLVCVRGEQELVVGYLGPVSRPGLQES